MKNDQGYHHLLASVEASDHLQMSTLSPWFPPNIKPVYKGYYNSYAIYKALARLRYWDGKKWVVDHQNNDDGIFQECYWQGLAEKPSA